MEAQGFSLVYCLYKYLVTAPLNVLQCNRDLAHHMTPTICAHGILQFMHLCAQKLV